jgi:hypothetical protein
LRGVRWWGTRPNFRKREEREREREREREEFVDNQHVTERESE